MKPVYKLSTFAFILSMIYSCGPKPVALSSKQLAPYLAAIAKVKHLRDSLGFSPIADTAKITVEGRADYYDAMLHIQQQNSSRNIAFKQHGADMEWIGEQEIFPGPRYIKTTDGEIKESITLSYEKVPYSGHAPGYLSVEYQTPDSAKTSSQIIPEREAKQMIKDWGKSN